jgi:FMN phosphatase YigB (HAD superfamily)
MNDDRKKAFVFDFDCTLTFVHLFYLLFNTELFIEDFQHQVKYVQKVIEKYKNMGYSDIKSLVMMIELALTSNFYVFSKVTDDIIVDIVFGGIERVSQLRELMHTLKNNGFNIFISSNSPCNIIVRSLKYAKLYDLVEKINTTKKKGIEEIGEKCIYEYSKSLFIENLLFEGYLSIYYVDDSTRDLKEIKEKMKEHSYFDVTLKYFGENIGLKNNDFGLNKDIIKNLLEQLNIKTKKQRKNN